MTENKIDALICAIRMLVGQMQAERDVSLRLAQFEAVWAEEEGKKEIASLSEADSDALFFRLREPLTRAELRAAGRFS